MKYNNLTPEEEEVILNKSTELPFSGIYNDFYEDGVYMCKRCDAPLFLSQDKFQSGCGWPSFDNEIPDAIKRHTDADGVRTEITCSACGGHLGHIFFGEKLTPKNTRYCVNSISMKFIPGKDIKKAVFAGGCFWGVEYHFRHYPGVIKTIVGYTGGHTVNPTYEQVCSGETGHAEALEIMYNSTVVDYEDLVKLFFQIHDPTQLNRQGPDIGSQYSSAIFYFDDTQKKAAEDVKSILESKGIKIQTSIEKAGRFYPAEDYHQRYYEKTKKVPYCHSFTKRF